jgi:hypothetical protein
LPWRHEVLEIQESTRSIDREFMRRGVVIRTVINGITF